MDNNSPFNKQLPWSLSGQKPTSSTQSNDSQFPGFTTPLSSQNLFSTQKDTFTTTTSQVASAFNVASMTSSKFGSFSALPNFNSDANSGSSFRGLFSQAQSNEKEQTNSSSSTFGFQGYEGIAKSKVEETAFGQRQKPFSLSSSLESGKFQGFQPHTNNLKPTSFGLTKSEENQFKLSSQSASNFSFTGAERSGATSVSLAGVKKNLFSNSQNNQPGFCTPIPKTSVDVPSPPKGLFSAATTSFQTKFQDPNKVAPSFSSDNTMDGSRKRLFSFAGHQDKGAKIANRKRMGEPVEEDTLKEPAKRLVRKAPIEGKRSFEDAKNKQAITLQNVVPPAPPSNRRRLSSSSTPLVDSVAIQCTKVPQNHNDKDSLRRHFSRFGEVVRVRSNPLRNSATIHFANPKEAALAKEKGKNFFGRQIHIYSYIPRTPSSEKTPLQQKSSNSASFIKAPLKLQSQMKRTLPDSTTKSSSLLGRTNADKLAILDKIDKLLRSSTVRESDLSKAVVAIGTCPDMCPEKERYLRLQKNLLSSYEMGPNKTINHNVVVKEYSRSSADQEEALPHELRSSRVLRTTMDYLLTHVMHSIDYEKTAEWYDFIWNRTRAIRKEMSIQQLNDPLAIEVIEECARFHICCAHELCEMDVSNFDPKINNENLEKTMKTVLDMYLDVRLKFSELHPPNEAEFQSYFILLNINRSSDVLSAVKNMSPDIRYSSDVRLAVSAFSALHSNNYSRFFSVVEKASYLQAALLHRYFNQVRQQAIRIMAKAYTSKPQSHIPVDDVIRTLRFNDVRELESFCSSHEVNIVNGSVVLLRALDYTAESLPSFCSLLVSSKMIGQDLCYVIANGRRPSSVIPQSSSSFDDEGYYIGAYAELLKQPFSSSILPVKESPSKKLTLIPPQDSSLKEVYEILKQKGISNDVIKSLARELLLGVIEEGVLEVTEKEIQDAQYHVISEHVTSSFINEAVEEELKEIASSIVVAEQMEKERKQRKAEEAERKRLEEIRRKEEEERRRLELERLEREIEECKERSSLKVADDLENLVVTQLIGEAANTVFKEELFNRQTATTSNLLLMETVSTMLSEIVADCVKTERKALHSKLNKKLQVKLAGIRVTKWRQQLEKLRMYRLACELFPCTSLSRDIHQQIDELLPDKRRGFLVERPITMNLSFSDRVATHKQLHEHVLDRIPGIGSLHYSSLPMGSYIQRDDMIQTSDDQTCNSFRQNFYWKLSIASPDGNKDTTWFSWLQHQFDFRTMRSCRDTVLKDVISIASDIDPIAKQTMICCKMLSSNKRMKSDIFGTSALVVMLTDLDFSALDRLKKFFDNLFESIRPKPSIPLLVLCCGCPAEDEVLNTFLSDYPVLTSFRVLSFPTEDFVWNGRKLLSGVEWLESQSSASGLRVSRLQDFVEDQLLQHYTTPLYRDMGVRNEQGLPNLNPYLICEIYNKILDDICRCITDRSLKDYSWPAVEFYEHRDSRLLPHSDWNSEKELVKIEQIFEQLKLPDLPLLHSCADVKEIEKKLRNYCYRVRPEHHHLAASVSQNILSYADDNDLDDAVNFFHHFSWQRLIDTIASALLEDVIYSELGNRVVAYEEESLELIKLPEKFTSDAATLEFQNLDDTDDNSGKDMLLEPSLHSIEEGAQGKLKKILEATSSMEKTLSSETSWMDDDDVLEQSANHAASFREEIQTELEESERFEGELQRIIENGAAFLQQFSSSQLQSFTN